MKESASRALIWLHYLALVFVALYASGSAVPSNRQALLFISISSVAVTTAVHVYSSVTGNLRMSLYFLLGFDLIAICATAVFTGMIYSPFIFFLPLVASMAWFVDFKIKAALGYFAAAVILLMVSFHVWMTKAPPLQPLSFDAYPVFTTAAISMQVVCIVCYLAMVVLLPNPLLEELARQEALLAEQKHKAEIGASFTVITHEMRNPLSALSGNLQILKTALEHSSSHRKSEWLSRIKAAQASADRISEMLESILSYARERQGTYFMEKYETSALVDRAVNFVRMKYANLDFMISRIKGAQGPIRVLCDADAVLQVLVNLLDNSINARDGRKQLEIEIHEEVVDGKARVTVHDNGKGISARHLPFVFGRFVTNRRDGSGIGLFISRQIIEDHKGNISAHSVEGLGTAMRFTLPLAGDDRAA